MCARHNLDTICVSITIKFQNQVTVTPTHPQCIKFGSPWTLSVKDIIWTQFVHIHSHKITEVANIDLLLIHVLGCNTPPEDASTDQV